MASLKLLMIAATFALLCIQSTVGAQRKCKNCKFPKHSWDTLPVSFHSALQVTNATGTFSPEGLQEIIKFPLVTIEKWQGFSAQDDKGNPVFLWEEDAMINAATKIKQANPDISVVVWFDTMLIYTGWNTSGAGLNRTLNKDIKAPCATGHFRPAEFLEKNRDYLLKNKSGKPALEPWSFCHIYDHTQPKVRQYWTDMCLNMTDSGVIDGCGADFSAMEQNRWAAHTPEMIMNELELDNATAYAWAAGHRQMMKDTTEALLPGVLMAKDGAELGDHANGVLHEGCRADNATVLLLQNLTAKAKAMNQQWVYQCHQKGGSMNHSVAAFLIGAGPGHYFSTGGWHDGASRSHWNPIFDLPLGEPLSDGVYDGAMQTWTRKFSKGTNVTFYPANNSGVIDWAVPPVSA